MANFDFSLSSDIVLGSYSLARIGERVAEFSSKVMLITDPAIKESGLIKKVQKALEDHSISVFTFDDMVQHPSSDIVERTLNLARGAKVDGIIGLGGMSVCSIARCTASIYNETESIYDFFEGKEPKSQPLPLIQIPTTCRDPFLFLKMTPIMDARNRATKLLKLQHDLGSLAVFDPNVFSGYPKHILTSLVFAGLTAAFEGYISTKSNFFSKTILRRAIELFLLTINKQKEKLIETSIEQVLSEATCLTAIGLSSSQPGLGTAISLATSSRYDISSSLVATILFPYVVNDAIKSNLDKVVDIARMLETELVDETDLLAKAQAGVIEIRRLLSVSNLPMRLKDIELTIESLVPVAQDAASLSFISYLPRPMASSGIFELIKEAYWDKGEGNSFVRSKGTLKKPPFFSLWPRIKKFHTEDFLILALRPVYIRVDGFCLMVSPLTLTPPKRALLQEVSAYYVRKLPSYHYGLKVTASWHSGIKPTSPLKEPALTINHELA